MNEMGVEERMRLWTAAGRAKRLYPGPVGELLYRELRSWEEFGYRLGGDGLIWGVVDTIMAGEPGSVPSQAA